MGGKKASSKKKSGLVDDHNKAKSKATLLEKKYKALINAIKKSS